MALYMLFHVVPDSHIEFLANNPSTFRAYLEGVEPTVKNSLFDKLLGREVELSLPGNWPGDELEGYCPEVNHRQVKYFHYLLNGTTDRVDHEGCLFQTWFAPRVKTPVVTIDGENFALRHEHIDSLRQRIRQLSADEICARYEQALEGERVDDATREFLLGAFEEIASACDNALETKAGLMWTAG